MCFSQSYLNTSYVKVQLPQKKKKRLYVYNLNTSYVKVQYKNLSEIDISNFEFKYILC